MVTLFNRLFVEMRGELREIGVIEISGNRNVLL
ncbi:Uncharacterised protein [Mycobacteroides abscessus subsp. abscessus]|nr:Uncharacterised protein [Mycobacteroides abscessus subsp. abscessus]